MTTLLSRLQFAHQLGDLLARGEYDEIQRLLAEAGKSPAQAPSITDPPPVAAPVTHPARPLFTKDGRYISDAEHAAMEALERDCETDYRD